MILFLGDSITEGWKKEGQAHWDAHWAPRGAENRGHWGDDTDRLVRRIEGGLLDGLAPEQTVLLIGTNDIPWDPPRAPTSPIPARVVANVTRVVEAVRAKLPGTELILLGIFPRGEKQDFSRVLIPLVNAGLAQVPGVRFVDLGHVFLEGDTIPSALMPDTLHLSAAAYERWANALTKII